jgi:hypothetical protein
MTRVLLAALAVTAAFAITRAQSNEFYTKRTALRRQAEADQRSQGLAGPANRAKLFSTFPTPEVTLAAAVRMAPGATAPLAFKGKFSDKTTFLSGNDVLTLSDIVVAPNSFKATATVKAGVGPQWARVYAIAPVSGGETWTPIFIGTPQAYTLTAAKNGWTIQLTPDAKDFAVDTREAKVGYKAEYFKRGETKPFETATGTLTLNASNMDGSLSFSMQAGNQGSAMAEMEKISLRMGELMKAGKYDSKELADLQKKMEVVQERMMKEVQAQMADPAAVQKKQDDFGCSSIYVSQGTAGLRGNVSCGKNVGSLDLTVAVK